MFSHWEKMKTRSGGGAAAFSPEILRGDALCESERRQAERPPYKTSCRTCGAVGHRALPKPTGSQAYFAKATKAEGGRNKCAILPNEPTVLEEELSWNIHITICLCRLQRVFAGGFVLENEPTGGVFWGVFGRKVDSFTENEASEGGASLPRSSRERDSWRAGRR